MLSRGAAARRRAAAQGCAGRAAEQGQRSFEEGDANPGAPQGTTTIYVGNVEFITRAGISLVKRYIGDFLVITTENNADRHDILLRDGLGSIDAIVSETGLLRQRLSFDAHGSRRLVGRAGAPELWDLLDLFSAAAADTRTTTRGYTGHEQLDGVGLIHMNARLYDPEIGRFIQADSMVEPEATQGLNRYSYVLNNPLTFTDPTGQLSFRQVVGLAVGVAFAIWSGNLWAADKLLASFLAATAGGFTSTLIATGSLRSALWSAVSAAAFWGIGTGFSATTGGPPVAEGVSATVRFSTGSTVAKIAAHAGAGGVLAHLQGGKFGNAFFAAGVTKWASPAVSSIGMGDGQRSFADLTAQTVVAATVGGTASMIAGGSFGNGAQTAAFQHLFNEAVHFSLYSGGKRDNVQMVEEGSNPIRSTIGAVPGVELAICAYTDCTPLQWTLAGLAGAAVPSVALGMRLIAARAGTQLTGQIHHGISRTVHKALEAHPNLRGVYSARDPRFVTQAKDLASHRGYDTFHRNLDAEVAGWVRGNPNATQVQFESYLRGVYQRPDVAAPHANDP